MLRSPGQRPEMANRLDISQALDITDHGELYIACKPVSGHWKELGARLGVLKNALVTIEADCNGKVDECMSAILEKWLRRPVEDVFDGTQPTWRILCEALSHIDKPMAEKLAEEHELHNHEETSKTDEVLNEPGQHYEMAKCLDITDYGELYIACKPVRSHWEDLGARLGVLKNTLDTIEADCNGKVEKCMSAMLEKWLRRPVGEVYDRVQPTWGTLCEALSHIDRPMAITIAKEHGYELDSSASANQVALSSDVTSQSFLPQMCGCGKCTIIEWRTGKICQNSHKTNFPKLLIIDSKHPKAKIFEQNYDKHATLCEATKCIINQFQQLVKDIWELLFKCAKKKQVDIVNITRMLRNELKTQLPMFSDLDSLQNYFHSLRVSWYNFRALNLLVKQVVVKLSPKLSRILLANWNNYLTSFEQYCSTRNLKEYSDVFFRVEEHNIFLLEVDNEFQNFTLSDIECLSDSLSIALKCPAVCLHLVTVREGCLIIYLYYSYSDYLSVFESLKEEQLTIISQIKSYRILSLTDLHGQFKYKSIQSYSKTALPGDIYSSSSDSEFGKGTCIGNDPSSERKKDDELDSKRSEIELLKKQSCNKDAELREAYMEIKRKNEEIEQLKRQLQSREYGPVEISTVKKDVKYSTKEAEMTHTVEEWEVEQLQAVISNTKSLQDFIVKSGKKVSVYPLLLTVGGLPKCGKTTSLIKAFSSPLHQNFPLLSHHEFELVLSGMKRPGNMKIHTVKTFEGFKASILSAIFSYHCKVSFEENLGDNSTFTDPELKTYIKQTAHFIHEQQAAYAEHKTNGEESDENCTQFDNALEDGIGLANVWNVNFDTEQTGIQSLFECFSILFTQKFIWLFINLERDIEMLHIPPEDISPEMRAVQWRPRIQCLLHTCLMSKRFKLGKNLVCQIFATYTQEHLTRVKLDNKIAKLKRECKNAAKQMGIQDVIDFKIVEVDLRNPKELLQSNMKSIFAQPESHCEIPISWLFLCGSFSNHRTFYMTITELKQKALVCNVPFAGQDGMDEFCKFFTSFGSIIDLRQIDQTSQFIIVKPWEFFSLYNNLFISEKKRNSTGMINNYGQQEAVVMDVLVSVGLAIKLSPVSYFVPSFRSGMVNSKCNPNAVRLILGIDSPDINMQIEVLKQLLNNDYYFNAYLDLKVDSESANCITVRTVDTSHEEVGIQLISQGNVMEICYYGENKHKKEVVEIRCMKLVEIVKKITYMKSYLFKFTLQYQFAVRCEKDNFDPSLAFNAHRRQHILPCKSLCCDCKKKGIEFLQVITAWTEALHQNPIPKAMKLKGDLYSEDFAKIASEISFYPWKAVSMLADELKVKIHPTKPLERKERASSVMQMLTEWDNKYQDEELPKTALAQMFMTIDTKWRTMYINSKEDGEKEPKFKRLARQLDIQVFSPNQMKAIYAYFMDKEDLQCTT